MTPHRPRPLCAICADREATTATDWELRGVMREVPACEVCLAPARYRAPRPAQAIGKRPAQAPMLAKGRAILDALPDAFDSNDAARVSGLTGHRLGPVLRALSVEGLIVKTNARFVDTRGETVQAKWRKTEQARRAA